MQTAAAATGPGTAPTRSRRERRKRQVGRAMRAYRFSSGTQILRLTSGLVSCSRERGATSVVPTLSQAARRAEADAGQTGGAVLRGGLKNGVGTTTALTRWRAASTVTSISSAVLVANDGASIVASAISFFSTGDHVVEVAFPTCRVPR